ncbi:MAG TPA: hypothetical protein VIT45_07920 [Allosphingosinicella sp.]
MFVRTWRYQVDREASEAFERSYGPDGDWARLFARGSGFLGTELLSAVDRGSGDALVYATIDRWRTRQDWDAFLADHGEAYHALDLRLENLTIEEQDLGDWLSV